MWAYFGYAALVFFVLFMTGMLNPILYLLFEDKKFSGLEIVAINAWRECLSEEQKKILDVQLNSLNLVQKGAGGAKAAAYYKIKVLPPPFENSKTAVGGSRNPVATVEFVDHEQPGQTSLKAKIYLNGGRIFSVEYPKSPKRFAAKHGLKLENFVVKKVIQHVSL